MSVDLKKKKDACIAILVWIYVIEATTFYVKSNIVDNFLQMGFALVIILIPIANFTTNGWRIQFFCFLYFLLIGISLLPDLVSGYIIGVRIAITYALPLCIYILLHNSYYNKLEINKTVFIIPVIYGTIVAAQGIILEVANFVNFPVKLWNEMVPKTGNEVTFSSIFRIPMGAYATWGKMGGRPLLRLQGYYIEPSKFAAFLLIPILLTWGIYKETHRYRYMLSCIICTIAFGLTMSRAGYISLIGCIVFGMMFKRKRGTKKEKNVTTQKDLIKVVVAIILFLCVAVCTLVLMVALSSVFPNLEFLNVGISDYVSGKANLVRHETVASKTIIDNMVRQPWGFGFSNTLHGMSNTGFDTNLANAFILWFVTGGFLGAALAVAIIIILIVKYCIPCLKSKNYIKIAVGMIFLGLTIHGLSYGTWISPDYIMILSIMSIIANKKIVWS